MKDNGHCAVQGHSRSPILIPIESPCDFLLVITTNLHPTSYRFEVIADYWSNLRFRQRGTPLWHTRSGWTPKLRTMKFSLKKLETLLYRMVLKYRQGVEISTDYCFILSQYTRLTDGQMDRQTDGQMSIAISCICVRSRTVKIAAGTTFWDANQSVTVNHCVSESYSFYTV